MRSRLGKERFDEIDPDLQNDILELAADEELLALTGVIDIVRTEVPARSTRALLFKPFVRRVFLRMYHVRRELKKQGPYEPALEGDEDFEEEFEDIYEDIYNRR